MNGTPPERYATTTEQSKVDFWIYAVGYPIILCVGIVGNTLNNAVLWMSSRMRRPSFVFLRALAVVDFLVLIVLVTFDLVRSRLLKQTKLVIWYYSHVCFFLFRSLMCASNLIIVALTVDRYLHVVHHNWRYADKLREKAVLVLFLITLFSFVLHIPHTIETDVTEFLTADTNESFYNWEWANHVHQNTFLKYVYPVLKETFNRFIPIAFVLTLNPLILRAHRLMLARKRYLTPLSASQRKLIREERRLIALLTSACAVFLVCTLPQAAVTIVLRARLQLYPENHAFYVFVHVANLIEAANFSVDFYVYSVTSSDFRRSFRDVFRVRACAGQSAAITDNQSVVSPVNGCRDTKQ